MTKWAFYTQASIKYNDLWNSLFKVGVDVAQTKKIIIMSLMSSLLNMHLVGGSPQMQMQNTTVMCITYYTKLLLVPPQYSRGITLFVFNTLLVSWHKHFFIKTDPKIELVIGMKLYTRHQTSSLVGGVSKDFGWQCVGDNNPVWYY